MELLTLEAQTFLSPYTTRLFSRPSFVEGMGRLFDFAGILSGYTYDKTEKLADFNALRSDWCAVGDDIRVAIKLYQNEFQVDGAK